MIRYEIKEAQLLRGIARLAPNWLASAKKKTARFKEAKRYNETRGSWSQVKPVYVAAQGGKCAYCERRFSVGNKSMIEHDIEHFRPKNEVKAWPPEGSKRHYAFETGGSSPIGYYLLAYNPLNYVAACKKCNSPYKSNYFPIAGPRRFVHSGSFDTLAKEQPLLVYPLGDVDEDPEELITFVGIFPTPAFRSGPRNRRARVIIDFFDLDVREELLRERAELLKAIYVAFQDLNHRDDLRRQDAQQTIDQLENPKLKHRNCARSYYGLCQSDPAAARQHYELAIRYLNSVDG